LVELVEEVSFIFVDTLNYESELLVWKKSTLEDAREKLELLSTFLESIGGWSTETLEEKTMPWIKENGFGNGDVLWPMRVALSGKKNSPGPFEIASVLGKEKTLLRLERARKKLAL
jgi:glutamyl-tRNA synthetase